MFVLMTLNFNVYISVINFYNDKYHAAFKKT